MEKYYASLKVSIRSVYMCLIFGLPFQRKLHCQFQGNLTSSYIPTQVESNKTSQIQWPVVSIKVESIKVDVFLGE